jgi:hypothetical protein
MAGDSRGHFLCHLPDNAFTDIEDFEKAQTLSGDLDIAKLHHRLDEYAGVYCPVIKQLDVILQRD